MSLNLIPPGGRTKRKRGKTYTNQFYYVRGWFNGKRIETSTDTADPFLAQKYKASLELQLLEGKVPGAGDVVTFVQATNFYLAYKKPSKGDCQRIAKLVGVLGAKPIGEIQHADLVATADLLYPGRKNETKNRGVIKPVAAILHYAAENKWCPWLRIRKLKEGPVVTRASSMEVAHRLIGALRLECEKATSDYQRNLANKKCLLILWLFRHGNRISDPLTLNWSQIDLERGNYSIFVQKTQTWRLKPLEEEVVDALMLEPIKEGRLFPWETKSGVYKWLRPLRERVGVTFTPHMARHYVGSARNRDGVALATIMEQLDHADGTSSLRYQHAGIEAVREAQQRSSKVDGRLLVKKPKVSGGIAGGDKA